MLKMVKKSLRRQYLDWLIFVNRMDIRSRRGSGMRSPVAPCSGGAAGWSGASEPSGFRGGDRRLA
ncbi:hypothetical protein X961_4761 [Burkholderia pseudomallei MSHR5613]|nr:hypothetical protein X961_4761 [Burkholderia pseudomallei MSHR5613]